MPEGDTVFRTAQRLHEALTGREVRSSDLRWPTLATADLAGTRTLEVRSRGKHILHRFDSGLTLHSHLRMEGSWRIDATRTAPGTGRSAPRGGQGGVFDARRARRPRPPSQQRAVRAVITTAAWTATGVRLGMLDLVQTRDEDRLVGHLGPDVLGPDWDPDVASARLSRWDGPIGAALLDQRNLAGVGTFWASECLFLERIDPWSRTRDIDRDVLASLVARVQHLIEVGAQHGVQSSTGIHRAGHTSYVHGRAREACRRCGDRIRVDPIGPPPTDRVLFHCPRCQGGDVPTTARV